VLIIIINVISLNYLLLAFDFGSEEEFDGLPDRSQGNPKFFAAKSSKDKEAIESGKNNFVYCFFLLIILYLKFICFVMLLFLVENYT
jgi:hypothetical protein